MKDLFIWDLYSPLFYIREKDCVTTVWGNTVKRVYSNGNVIWSRFSKEAGECFLDAKRISILKKGASANIQWCELPHH